MTAVADVPAIALTGAGVYEIPEDAYHADPVPGGSITSTGARKILAPGCPALFRYEQLHGRPEKRTFDIGHAAHKLVLGVGARVVVVEADDWRTKAAKEQRDAAYAAGHVPLLAAEHAQVVAMAEALHQHPVASVLFDPERGKPEQSLFWQDETHGVTRRARLDWLPDPIGGRLIVPDFKTCVSAEPRSLAKSVANYGYHQQAEWYLAAVRALGLADEDAAFVFVAQEKTPPYLVTVFELDSDALRIGRERNQQALEVYAECRATDTWPSYTSDVELISLPAWATYQHQELAS